MTHRTWTDAGGRTWMVSRYPTRGALAVPLDWKLDSRPAPRGNSWRLRFRDPENPAKHGSVAYTSEKPVSDLSDEEMAEYWEQVVADHPELA